jgi:large conductance mechanosensitive channel
MIKGFRDFILRGNVLDLAVAVVIGAAFTVIINSVVKGFITPLVAAIFGEPDLTQVWTFEINGAIFSIGLILDAVFNFLCVAAAVYFFIVLPANKLQEMRRRGQVEEPEAVPDDLAVLMEIRDLLRTRPL